LSACLCFPGHRWSSSPGATVPRPRPSAQLQPTVGGAGISQYLMLAVGVLLLSHGRQELSPALGCTVATTSPTSTAIG
jgi:hypothetical protein